MRRVTLFLILMVLASSGCRQGIGPRRLSVDRTAYIEALGESWKEQTLFNIVKLRYGDSLTFLDISSINQAYDLDASVRAGYDAGWGAGTKSLTTALPAGGGASITSQRGLNVFPSHGLSLGASSTYRSSPTITYSPIPGEVITKTIFTPLDIKKLFDALKAGWQTDFIIPYCVISINNVKSNPADLRDMSKLVQLWDELDDCNAISYSLEDVPEVKKPNKDEETKGKPDKKGSKTKGTKEKPAPWDEFANNLVKFTNNLVKRQKEEAPKKEKHLFLILDLKKAHKHLRAVRDFKDLLGLEEKKEAEAAAKEQEKFLEKYQVVPGTPSEKQNLSKIYVRTRSVFQILNLLAKFIYVPTYHERPISGGTWVFPGLINDKKRINWYTIPHFEVWCQRGLVKPNEFTAIRYKDHWFYILNGDPNTKRVFSGLVSIFSMMESGPPEKPILTIPVR